MHCVMHPAAGSLQTFRDGSPLHISHPRAWCVADHAVQQHNFWTLGRLQDLTDKLADARVQAAEGVTLAQQHSGQPAWQAQMAELQSKLALTNQKLTARDASARKYKVGDSMGMTRAALPQGCTADVPRLSRCCGKS